MSNRSNFSSKIGFVLAAAGSAVGLETFGVFHILLPVMAEEHFYLST